LIVIITARVTQSGARYDLIAAQEIVSLAPPVILAIVFQKYLIKRLTLGAVKGELGYYYEIAII